MKSRALVKQAESIPVQQLPGIVRRTLSYNQDVMMCRFELEKGAHIPLHNHVAVQNGYVLEGKLLFVDEKGAERVVEAGDSYVLASGEPHEVTCLEPAVLVENFIPAREEYM